ncbi:MAG: hypothetical protein EA427_11350 [Spirochaetaceae bacterium]|nr:MAG: hypothetical protein EA427_11350 [Spirochaetaceae bacterium]
MRGHEVRLFEKKLKALFDRIDVELEEEWGDEYPLHPARAEAGTVGNPEHEGLFSLGASFSAGFGSAHGRGYVMEIRLATLADVPGPVLQQIRDHVGRRCGELLPEYFPDRDLDVVRENDTFKITGDLSLR